MDVVLRFPLRVLLCRSTAIILGAVFEWVSLWHMCRRSPALDIEHLSVNAAPQLDLNSRSWCSRRARICSSSAASSFTWSTRGSYSRVAHGSTRSSEPGVRRKTPRCLDMPGALQDPLLRLRHSADAAGGRPLLLGTNGAHDRIV